MTMRLYALILSALTLAGCTAVATTTATQVGLATADGRSYGTTIDDNIIYARINEKFLNADVNDLLPNVTVNVRNRRVMLTGNVEKEETAARAAQLAWQVQGVEEVINEIVIVPDTSVWDTASDIAIKKNLETRLLLTKDVWVINYSIDVVNGTAYLLGNCYTQAELERALNVARTTKGVNKVVSHLRVVGGTPPG
jgi:osmotically-inducible protein OsmY